MPRVRACFQRVLRLDACLQLVPGVGGLLQALVGRDLAGQGLTEERMEGFAPDAVPDCLSPRPRQLQLLAPERDIDPRGIGSMTSGSSSSGR